MKEKVFSVIAICCFLAIVGTANARAQMAGTTLRAMIPFDFSVRGRTLPAGEYEIKRVADTSDVLVISGVINHDHEVFETEPVIARRISSKGEIIFHRYGDSYFLSEVFDGGEQTGRELPQSRQERNLKREVLASNDQKNRPETVAIAVY